MMPKVKPCSPELADAIIACWRADATGNRISKELYGDLWYSSGRIQVWIPSHNKLANNALWDGDFPLARKYLIACGLAGNEAKDVSKEKEIIATRRTYARNQFAVARMKDAKSYSNATQSAAGIRRKRA